MIKLIHKVPKTVYVACSGGVDSMAALDFLRRNHQVNAAFFNHGTETSQLAWEFLNGYCKDNDIGLVSATISKLRLNCLSQEEHWRNERYKFLDSIGHPVVTAHHLDDAVETWVWSSMHGTPKLPQLIRGNVIRPFLATRKQDLVDWCINHNVPWIEDRSNLDIKFTRNYIRNEMMSHVLRVNPGIHKMLKKRLTNDTKAL